MSENSLNFGNHRLNDGCSPKGFQGSELSVNALLIKIMTRDLRPKLRAAILREPERNQRVVFGIPGFTIKASDFSQDAIIFLKVEDYFVDRRLPEEVTGNQQLFSYQQRKYDEIVIVRKIPHLDRLKFIACGKPYDILAGSNNYRFIEGAISSTDCIHATSVVRGGDRQSYLRDNFSVYQRAELLV